MKILKIINNNIVSSLDTKNREIIIMGKGIGFGKKAGMEVDETQIEKIFRMASEGQTKRLEDLLNDVSLERVQLVNKIITKAKEYIHEPLQESIYITLIDHINFALERKKQNIQFQNPLFYDVKRLYKDEYRVGMEAVKYINQTLGTDLPDGEAASIALHLINAKLGKEMPDTMNIAKILQNTLKIVQYFFNTEIEGNSLQAEYFINHIKFFSQRVISGEMLESKNPAIDQMISENYPKSSQCVARIASYILKEYKIQITQGEVTDLIIQIERITGPKQEGKNSML
jgi:Transcriptional antiterminator